MAGEGGGSCREKIKRCWRKGEGAMDVLFASDPFVWKKEAGFKRRLELPITLGVKENTAWRQSKENVKIERRNEEVAARNRKSEEIVGLILRYEPNEDGVDEEVLEEMELLDNLDEMEGIKKTEFYLSLVSELFPIEGKLKDEKEGESVQELKSMIDGIKKIYEGKRGEIKGKKE